MMETRRVHVMMETRRVHVNDGDATGTCNDGDATGNDRNATASNGDATGSDEEWRETSISKSVLFMLIFTSFWSVETWVRGCTFSAEPRGWIFCVCKHHVRVWQATGKGFNKRIELSMRCTFTVTVTCMQLSRSRVCNWLSWSRVCNWLSWSRVCNCHGHVYAIWTKMVTVTCMQYELQIKGYANRSFWSMGKESIRVFVCVCVCVCVSICICIYIYIYIYIYI